MHKIIIVGMQIGLFGKANVGKSTFFSAATQTSVKIKIFHLQQLSPTLELHMLTLHVLVSISR